MRMEMRMRVFSVKGRFIDLLLYLDELKHHTVFLYPVS